jgi:hypothetical protein
MAAAVEAVATVAAVVVAVAAVMAAVIADLANTNLYSFKKRSLSQVGRFLLIPFREAAVMCR